MPDCNARVVLTLVLGSTLVGCTPKPAEPGTPPPAKICTEMGCISGLRVQLSKSTPWPAGDYELAFDIDGAVVTCKGALPLPACDEGPALTCDVADKVQVSESGCALPPAQHGFADLQFTGEPAHVKVTIRQGATVLHTADVDAEYKTLQPNGPECEPTCRSASGSITVP